MAGQGGWGSRKVIAAEKKSSKKYSHPTVKRTPLPLARAPVFLWIPGASLHNSEEVRGIGYAILWMSESVFLYNVSLDSKITVVNN